MRTLALACLSPLVALSLGCAPEDDEEEWIESQQAPVIAGEDSQPGEEDSTILLVHASGRGVGACTGTMVAPNLVLTALHCVSETALYSVCDEEGNALAGGSVGEIHEADDLYVFTGHQRPQFGRGERVQPAGIGKRLFVPDSATLCNADIALVELQEPVADVVIAPIRLDGPAVVDELITAVGWGVTERTQSPNVRQRRSDIAILGVGPLTTGGMAAANTEFIVGESICSGDSGGPAFSMDSGEVLGVVSRGGNGQQGRNPADSCVGPRARNLYTGVFGHRDLILNAFDESGNLKEFGEACESNELCKQQVCAQTEGEGTTCNLDCSQEACPEGYECTEQDERQLCTLKVEVDDTDDDEKGGRSTTTTTCGCDVPGVSAPASWSWATGSLLFGLLCWRRRATRR